MNPEAPNKSKEETPMDGSDQVAVRQAKLDQMRENGSDPFRENWEQTHTSVDAKGLLPEDMEEGPEVSVAGRIVAFRLMGKATFLKILDRKGKIQSYVRRDEIGEEEYKVFKKLCSSSSYSKLKRNTSQYESVYDYVRKIRIR